MIYICIFLFISTLFLILALLYITSYNKINIYKIKMDNANNNIIQSLNEKHELMNKLALLIKKIIKKKDYLKDFHSLKGKNLTTYELDKELNTHMKTMKAFQEDYAELRTEEFDNIMLSIKELDQTINANKKFFNKNNNALIKNLKGFTKVVAKIQKISVKTSYETKEPKD